MFGTGILRNSRQTGLMDYAIQARKWLTPLPEELAIFHLTHQKAGSQWINRIFHALAYHRVILPEVESAATHERPIEGIQFLKQRVLPGQIYPTLYLTREQFASVRLPRHHRRFIVIRDPARRPGLGVLQLQAQSQAQLRLDERLPGTSEPRLHRGGAALPPR